MTNKKLTIAVVSFYGREMIEAHIRLSQKLNPGKENLYKWLIIENTPENISELKPYQVNPQIECEMVAGCEKIEEASQLVSWGSISHAMSLNKIIDRIDSEFLLVIDHDCLIVEEEWITKTLTHMERGELSFFGVPYYPSNYKCYRYFPCAICMFIDMTKVDKKSLDFMPQDHIYMKAHLIASLGVLKCIVTMLVQLLIQCYRAISPYIKNNTKGITSAKKEPEVSYIQTPYTFIKRLFSSSIKDFIKRVLKIIGNIISKIKKKLEIFKTYYAVSKSVRTLNKEEISKLSKSNIHLNSGGSLFKQSFREWINNLVPFLAVGAYKDTGWFIFDRFSQTSRSECLVPIWDKLNRKEIKFIADKYNLIPQREGYFVEKYLNASDPNSELIPEDWEKYLWNGKIFCFHASSVGHRPVEDRRKRVMIIVTIADQIASSNEPISHSSQTRDK